MLSLHRTKKTSHPDTCDFWCHRCDFGPLTLTSSYKHEISRPWFEYGAPIGMSAVLVPECKKLKERAVPPTENQLPHPMGTQGRLRAR